VTDLQPPHPLPMHYKTLIGEDYNVSYRRQVSFLARAGGVLGRYRGGCGGSGGRQGMAPPGVSPSGGRQGTGSARCLSPSAGAGDWLRQVPVPLRRWQAAKVAVISEPAGGGQSMPKRLTRFLPSALAWYTAASACSSRSPRLIPFRYAAKPMLMVWKMVFSAASLPCTMMGSFW
jgi:hypothetical protein